VQVHGVLQASRESGHDLVGVVAGAIEPPVRDPLYSLPQRIEQGRCGQRGGGTLIAGRGCRRRAGTAALRVRGQAPPQIPTGTGSARARVMELWLSLA
jgi:hypothetical protein